MENNTLVKKVTGGMFWTFAERFFAQSITAIVAIVLARVLSPEDYGIISIVMVLISIGDIFATNGIGNALVQKKEIHSIDYDSAFHLNVTVSVIIYAIIFLVAPYVSAFYNMEILTPVIRVMGIRIPIAAANSVQQAYVRRKMKFKFFFFATLGGTVISGIAGVVSAYLGMGVWALVIQYLANVIIDTCVLFLLNGWRPAFRFSSVSAKESFAFGWKLLVSELIATFGNKLKILLVGYSFGTADLAYYEQGNRYPSLLTTNVNVAINQVMLPVFSQSQDDLVQMKNMLRRTIQIGFFFLGPILIGFAVVSDNFVRLLLTEKWMGCLPYMKIFCIYFLTRPMEAATAQALQAVGRTDLGLYKMVIVNVMALICLAVAILYFHSVFLLACSSLLTMTVSMVINMHFAYKILNYRILEQLRDLIIPIVPSVMMGGVVGAIGCVDLPLGITFCVQIMIGIISYITFAWIFNYECSTYVYRHFRNMVKK